jgi:SSS family solute:Na+ symporter
MNIHTSLNGFDYGVIVAYAALLIGIGMFVSYRQRKSEDLFLAGRSLSWPNVGLSIFGTNIGPTFLIATCGAGYTSGMVTANFEWMAFIFLFILGMVFVPYYMHTKVSTMPEFMKKRFGGKCYTFMSWYALFSTVVLWLGGTLFAGGALLGQIMDWPLFMSVCVLAVIAASFTIAGGLAAVVITDSFQSILMIVGSAALALIGLSELGGIEKLAGLRVGELDPALTWKLFHPSGSDTPWTIFFLGYPVIGFWFWCTDQTIVQRVLGARDLRHGQAGTLFAGFLKILPPFIFLLPGIFAAVLLPGIEDDKAVFITMVTTYLPHGMIGLIVAVLIAAVISTVDSGLNSFSTVFTLDIYKRTINPAATDHALKRTGRWVTVAATVLAVAIAMFLSLAEGTNLFNLFQSIIGFLAPPVAAVFLLGLFWKRATSKAALATLIAGFAVCVTIGVLTILGIGTWPHFLVLTFYLFVANVVFMVLCSLVTRNDGCEEHFPPLRAAYAGNRAVGFVGWAFWALLFVVMIALYLFFN